PLPMTDRTVEEIIGYHEATKHHYDRYARSPGYMDWENQPNPFRFYEETRVIPLPLLKKDPHAGHQDLYERNNNHPKEFTIATIAGFLELSLGLSAWKAVGKSRWSLRMNPSSGNLHPTEAHLVLPQLEPVEAGVYHYNPLMHTLSQRAAISQDVWRNIRSHFGSEGFLIGLSSIFWRESWKYGERALRYCHHDVGHALAAISFSANLFGWKAVYLNGLADEAIAAVLGFDRTRYEGLEEEHPDLLCFIHPHQHGVVPRDLPPSIVSAFARLQFRGKPNNLSKTRLNWEIIYKTAQLTRKPATAAVQFNFGRRDWLRKAPCQLSAAEIIRQRRSATAFNRDGTAGKTELMAMLDKTLPRYDCAPFDVGLIDPATHLLIFVHNVEGLKPGLYFFFRNEKDVAAVKRIARSGFLWQPVAADFPFFLLEEGNFRQSAMMVSCHQEIAGFSAFSLGMIAAFSELITHQPFRYRHLYWETGMIGQVLYLEAEAHGLRGTGIGCFFDDAVHEIVGIADHRYQSLYHFTIGRPLEDPRLTTYPPYDHLKDR
ncbi:MAG: SagB/ThcOx family dehydrogenase, partial [Planctomycetales bacterium]|nr:SagB/ThcOx family dehydrogenase [Planctomycetales bacterium]